MSYFIQFSKYMLLFIAAKTTIGSSRLQMFFKIVVLEKFRNIHRKTPLLEQLYGDSNTGFFL